MPKIILYPTAVNQSYTSVTEKSQHPFSKILGLDPVTNSKKYTEFDYNPGGASFSELTYNFDFSKIPKNSIIHSVTLTVKGYRSKASPFEIAQSQCWLTDGTQGSDTNIYGNAYGGPGNKIALTDQLQTGTFVYQNVPYQDLIKFRFLFFGARGFFSLSKIFSVYLYGISITIDYSNPDKIFYKENNSWSKVTTAYKKNQEGWIPSVAPPFEGKITYIWS